jgi:hypothetical protein
MTVNDQGEDSRIGRLRAQSNRTQMNRPSAARRRSEGGRMRLKTACDTSARKVIAGAGRATKT